MPVADSMMQFGASPTAADFSVANVETGTSRRKLYPLSSASTSAQLESTVPFVETAWIVKPESAPCTAFRKSMTLPV